MKFHQRASHSLFHATFWSNGQIIIVTQYKTGTMYIKRFVSSFQPDKWIGIEAEWSYENLVKNRQFNSQILHYKGKRKLLINLEASKIIDSVFFNVDKPIILFVRDPDIKTQSAWVEDTHRLCMNRKDLSWDAIMKDYAKIHPIEYKVFLSLLKRENNLFSRDNDRLTFEDILSGKQISRINKFMKHKDAYNSIYKIYVYIIEKYVEDISYGAHVCKNICLTLFYILMSRERLGLTNNQVYLLNLDQLRTDLSLQEFLTKYNVPLADSDMARHSKRYIKRVVSDVLKIPKVKKDIYKLLKAKKTDTFYYETSLVKIFFNKKLFLY